MITVRCDRCGRELALNSSYTHIVTPASDTRWDFCSRCMIEFRQWVKDSLSEETEKWQKQNA